MRVDVNDVEMDDDLKVYLRGEPFTGEVVEHDPDGRLIGLTTYFNGVEDGPSAAWYPDGTPRAKGEAVNGMGIGLHETWFPNGRLAAQDEFDGTGRHLARRRWDEAGRLVEDRDYRS